MGLKKEKQQNLAPNVAPNFVVFLFSKFIFVVFKKRKFHFEKQLDIDSARPGYPFGDGGVHKTPIWVLFVFLMKRKFKFLTKNYYCIVSNFF